MSEIQIRVNLDPVKELATFANRGPLDLNETVVNVPFAVIEMVYVTVLQTRLARTHGAGAGNGAIVPAVGAVPVSPPENGNVGRVRLRG